MRVPRTFALGAVALLAFATTASAAPPTYTIYDIGLLKAGDTASQGLRISPGGVAVGRGLGSPGQAYSWTVGGGLIVLTNLASPARSFCVANGANDAGDVVGTGTTTTFGSSPLPVIWQAGVPSQLALPAGQTLGRANDVNNAHVAVGSIGSGSAEFAALWNAGVPAVITTTTPTNCFMKTAFSINNAGLIVGQGVDPANAARNVPFVHNSATNTSSEPTVLPGHNGGILFDVSEAGHMCGTSQLNQGTGVACLWDPSGTPFQIPIPVGLSNGIARGVNSQGWVVGNASTATSQPWMYDGTQSYRIQDLLPLGSGWDMQSGTSNSALGISEGGAITGTGLHNGQTRAYVMVPNAPVPTRMSDSEVTGGTEGILLRWSFSEPSDVVAVAIEFARGNTEVWESLDAQIVTDDLGMHAFDSSVAPGETRAYRLQVTGRDGQVSTMALASGTRAAGAGLSFALGAPTPNPSRGQALLAYSLSSDADAKITVLDARGRLVKTLFAGRSTAGQHVVNWDGTTDTAGRASTGLYFVYLQTIAGSKVQRVTLLP